MTELAITAKNLVGKVGVVRSISLDSELNKINNVGMEQGIFAKISGYGTISIATSSGLNTKKIKSDLRPELIGKSNPFLMKARF